MCHHVSHDVQQHERNKVNDAAQSLVQEARDLTNGELQAVEDQVVQKIDRHTSMGQTPS